jgi:hypothetical protein
MFIQKLNQEALFFVVGSAGRNVVIYLQQEKNMLLKK